MLRAPHILAAVFCCISVLSELVPAEPGGCPKLSNKTVDWVSMGNRSHFFIPGPYLRLSFFWHLDIYAENHGHDMFRFRCNTLKVPPEPSSGNDVEGVLDTDNDQFVMYMECNEHSKGHTKTITTYTVTDVSSLWEGDPWLEQITNKVKAAHIANGLEPEHLTKCIDIEIEPPPRRKWWKPGK